MTVFCDNAKDAALNYVKNNAGALHICSQEPANYTEGSSTYSLGSKASPTITGPAARAGGGRELTVAAITDGSVSGTGTASHECLVKTTATTELLTAKALSASQAVTLGNTFSLSEHKVGQPNPS
jgi:hypothetical protein